ncbi:MAG: tetratricopeptide repeat protein [Pseudomonadota bacterium]
MNPAQLQAAIAVWQKARALQQAGMLREAEAHFRKALQAMPRVPDLLADYGRLAEQIGDWRAAENIWRAAQQAAPDRSFGNHLGLALLQQERIDEALQALEAHHRKHPDDAPSLANLAVCYTRLQRDEDALVALRRSVRINPKFAPGWESLITLLINAGDREGAGAALDKARRELPANTELRYMEMEHRLKSFEFGAGFDLFDARWHTRFVPGAVRLPKDRLWQGEAFTGRLLVRAEQGIGDELLYSSLFADLQRRHADTVIDCDPRLLPLFARSYPALRFIPRLTPEDDPQRAGYARQCLLGDLPRLFRRSAADFPAQPGWLQPDAARRDAFAADYAQRFPGTRRVGLSWRSSNPGTGGAKSLTLDRLLPLLSVPGVQFFSLQYGHVQAEIDDFAARTGIRLYRDPAVDPTNDLDGLAAQMAALDLVISTSNSTVHLAGAVGVPVQVMLHRDIGLPWYWGYDAARVPWYPNTELLRCPRRGDWEPVIAGAVARLRQLAAT